MGRAPDHSKRTHDGGARKLPNGRLTTPEIQGALERARRMKEDLDSAIWQLERGAATQEQLRRLDRVAAWVDRNWLFGKKEEVDRAMRFLDACALMKTPGEARSLLAARVPEIANKATDDDFGEGIALMSKDRKDWYAIAMLLNRVLDTDFDRGALKRARTRRTKK